MRRLLFFAAPLSLGLGLGLGLLGCDQSCDPGSTPSQVHNASAGSDQYVCVPDDSPVAIATTPTPTATASSSSSSGVVPSFGDGGLSPDATVSNNQDSAVADADAGTVPSACGAIGVVSDEVIIVTKGVEPALVPSTPPDGLYSLAQASFYSADGGALGFSALRASLQITGATLLLGAETTEPMLESSESLTMSFFGGNLSLVCEASPGNIATLLPPPGGVTSANLAWDAVGHAVTFRIHASAGDIDFVLE